MPENQQKLKLLKQTLKNIKKDAKSALALLSEISSQESEQEMVSPLDLGMEDEKAKKEESLEMKESEDSLTFEIEKREIQKKQLEISPGTMINHLEKKEISSGDRIIEGVFNGQEMIDRLGKQYSVPANYASKSKLVEGDLLKLIITREGVFIYKQIQPIERQRLIGILVKDEESGEYCIRAQGKTYKVLMASITYFKGEENDRVVILVPQDKPSTWAAVENIIKA